MPKKVIIIIIIIVLVFLTVQFLLKEQISLQPEHKEIITANPFNTLPPTEYLSSYLTTVALGGFKPLLVDYLWIKQTKLMEDKQFDQIRVLLGIIAVLQPRFVEAWTFNSYNIIYNISTQEKTDEAKWRWVENGLNYIQEGMRYNPDNPVLMLYLALFYYHRIPQDRYFMKMVEFKESKDTYEVASQWYIKAAEVYNKERMFEMGNRYENMYLACRFLHAYELVWKHRYDDAIKELEFINSITLDTVEIARLKDLIELLKYEKQLGKFDFSDNDFNAKTSALLEQYKNLINKHIGFDFRPITEHIENMFNRYIKYSYDLISRGEYDKAQEQIKLLLTEAEEMIPSSDKHPLFWTFTAHFKRFNELTGLINKEIDLREQGVIGNRNNKEYRDIREAYRKYLSKYSRWVHQDEKDRLKNIFPE